MKKITIILVTILTIGLMNSGCKKYFEEKIPSPNDPTETSPDLLISNMELATFAGYSGQLARQGLTFTQHIAGTSAGSQSAEIARYVLTEQTNENEWGVIYTGALINGKILIDDFGSENPHYAGIARVLMAMNLGLATDLWGDVPYSDALNGLELQFEPFYDTQESLLDDSNPSSIFALLDQAIADLSTPEGANRLLPGGDDFIFGGDVTMWIKTANTLKARYYNRLSQRDPAGSATKVLSALAAGGITSSSEDCIMAFGNTAGQLNQWYDFEQNRAGYFRMGEYFVDVLKSNNDPRLPYFADSLTSGAYVGTPKNNIDSLNTSAIGSYIGDINSQIPLVSYVEAKFLEAEAELRGGSPGNAATAFNLAVQESVLEVTGAPADAAFISAYASESAGSITLETIMNQKYIAMFGQLEAYADFRRTDFPSTVTPNPNGNVSVIPVRFVTAQNERLYNSNATVVQDITQPVWWDN